MKSELDQTQKKEAQKYRLIGIREKLDKLKIIDQRPFIVKDGALYSHV